jgi:hypothetical protein
LAGPRQVQFQSADLLVVGVDKGQIGGDGTTHRRIVETLGDVEFLAIGGERQLLGERIELILAGRVLHMADQMSALPDEEGSAAEQIARLAHALGIDVGLRQGAAAKERGDLVGVDLVVLGLAAVDRLHEEGVSEDEVDTFRRAKVGDPVPGEHALAGDDEVLAERFEGGEELVGLGGQVLVEPDLSVLVEDADEEGSGMQIDAGVKSMGLVVEAHRDLLWGRVEIGSRRVVVAIRRD